MSPHSLVSLCSRSLLFVLLPAEVVDGEGEGAVMLTDRPRAAAGLRRFELASLLLLLMFVVPVCAAALCKCVVR